ncbi:MAG: hypothetical protein WCD29_03290 [Pseudolabrys sp.]|jgi:hypothetical protein
MMIDRPAFNYDNSGNPIVPAEASVEHNALVKAIESSDGPPHLWTLPPAKKNISGLLDWDKPRNEQGQSLASPTPTSAQRGNARAVPTKP